MDLATSVPGIDLSHYDDDKGNRPIHYEQMAAAVRWAIVRVGDGGDNDRSFARHITGLMGKVPLGTYFFCRPGHDPGQQAHAWANAVHRAESWGATFSLGHWADLEKNDGQRQVQVTSWVDSFLAQADLEIGERVGIYSQPSWWSVNMTGTPAGRRWWIARYPWQTDQGQPIGPPPPDIPAEWSAYVVDRRGHIAAPTGEPVSIWQWSSIGSGTAVGTYRPNALDCDLMDAQLFESVTAATVPTPVPVPAPPAHIDPEKEIMRFVKRPSPDDRAYLTNGAWKERMLSWPDLQQRAADLGIPSTVDEVDAGVVNRMTTIGEDPG